ncbi:hypothetical protein PLICRDRAFT_38994 [Plicaturopsis crispa FD-325 SS-3]|nr:hypothetical protein PLICRDRAFT_38994 [Plicaturopsis crispa FD-325 SS-3]
MLIFTLLAAAALTSRGAIAQNLSDDQVAVVVARLADGAKEPWELGTRAQALLEWSATQYSVMSSTSLPPPASVPSYEVSPISLVFDIAKSVVSGRAKSNGNVTGPQPLVQDGSAADPASIGPAVLLANWTGMGSADGLDYAGAAKDQLDFLFQNVPKTSDGAISHRTEYVQLWSDFVYMVPPFLAYYGVLSENRTLLLEGYNQISLYRNYLRDSSAGGMWKHVLLGPSGNDDGHWSTGNGWAAAGMLRVLATIQNSQYANTLKSQQKDLANWVQEIHDGIYPHLDSTDLFKNYPDRDLSTDASTLNFYDASSTALLASTVYRLSAQWGVHKHLPFAERSRMALSAPANSTNTMRKRQTESSTSTAATSASESRSESSASSSAHSDTSSASGSATASASASSSTSSAPTASSTAVAGLAHITAEGWLTPVVNPHSYGSEGSMSPEGQAFVVEMQAAWRDWVAAGSPGANSAIASAPALLVSLLTAVFTAVSLMW